MQCVNKKDVGCVDAQDVPQWSIGLPECSRSHCSIRCPPPPTNILCRVEKLISI